MAETRIKRKWEWVADKCKELGFSESEELARAIDETMETEYRDKHTGDWIEDYKGYEDEKDPEAVEHVAGNGAYCTACVVTEGCDECAYANEHEICRFGTSSFSRFLKMFDAEHGNE